VASRLRGQFWKIAKEVTPIRAWPDVPCSAVIGSRDLVINPAWSRRVTPRVLGVASGHGKRPRGVTEEEIAGRAAARMARQRVLIRDGPPAVWFLVDEAAFCRRTRSAEAMSAQFRHLAAVASLPGVTVQVVPPVMHAGLSGSLAIADAGAAYVDTPAGGMVFEDTETVRSLTIRFDAIRGEARPATELAAILSEAAIRHEQLAQEQLQQ
jgi:Domain of unknown function (DUF5753)